MELRLKDFKTFNKISITLRPLTILIGPPASGKSNLLEALAVLGFLGKLVTLNEQYTNPNDFCQAEPGPSMLLRIGNAFEVFPWMDYRSPAEIELHERDRLIRVKLIVKGRRLSARYSIDATRMKAGIDVPLYSPSGGLCEEVLKVHRDIVEAEELLRSNKSRSVESGKKIASRLLGLEENIFLESSDILNIINSIKNNFIDARLYGYERYGIETRLEEVTRCSYESCMQPHNVLAETGYNLAYMASSSPLPLHWLQEWLHEDIKAPIEIRVRTRMPREVLFFSKEVEVPSRLLSDTLLRVLYYLLALYTAARYVRSYDLKGRALVLLEEPEARAFPYSFEIIAKGIREALDAGAHVVLSTHNGLLLSKLLDTVREDELAVYYMYLDENGYSRVLSVDVSSLARKMLLLEDLLIMTPEEVLRELGSNMQEEEHA